MPTKPGSTYKPLTDKELAKLLKQEQKDASRCNKAMRRREREK
jgi:hypothetical protein